MKTVVYINFILTIFLIGAFVWLLVFQNTKNVVTQVISNDVCESDCKKQIEETVAKFISTISASTKESVTNIVVTPKPQTAKIQFGYIPITGPITTTSTEWYNAPGTEFYLDFNTDYGKSSYANWEAFLKVAHGNGTVYARLYDVTNNIAVNGSEVLITNKSDLNQVISGGLSFWAGNNLYRVQIKSLNSFEVTFGSGRIKIKY